VDCTRVQSNNLISFAIATNSFRLVEVLRRYTD
jgi:hypothetical protein